MKYDLSIIIVTYKSEKLIGPLLDSIKKSPDGLEKQIIVVDHFDQDKSAEIAQNHLLKPLVLEPHSNLGFSKGVNLGLKEAKGKYIFLINPDSRLAGNALGFLYSFAEKQEKLGAVVPRLLYDNGKIQPSVMKFPTIFNAFRFYFLKNKRYFGKYIPKKETERVDVAVMAAMLIPMSTIEKIGKLDERFFLYYEDIEFCRRLKKARLPIYYHAKAKIKHVHGASGNFKSHLRSPLAKSAQIYHGVLYSNLLNATLWLGQKWVKLLSKIAKIKKR